MILTKDQLFQNGKPKAQVFSSEIFGGDLKYHRCNVGEKSRARKMAQDEKGNLDNETLECALIIACVDEPKLGEIDLEQMKTLDSGEVSRLAGAILGKGAADPK